MPYASYVWHTHHSDPAPVGGGTCDRRSGLSRVLRPAVLRRGHARAGHLLDALSAARGPCDIRQRGDGGRRRADLAPPTGPPPGVAQALWPRLRGRRDTRRRVRDGDRSAQPVRTSRGGEQRGARGVVAAVHRARLRRRAAATPVGTPSSYGAQRDAGVVGHHQPDLERRSLCHVSTAAGQCFWGNAEHFNGSSPASARGWAGPSRWESCSGG